MRLRFEGCSTFKTVDRMVGEIVSVISNIPGIQQGDIVFKITIALRELLNNAVEHGNKKDISKKIVCEFSYDENTLMLKVMDQGAGFDISDVLYKISQKPLDRERFRGIFMVKSLGFFIETLGNQVIAKLHIN